MLFGIKWNVVRLTVGINRCRKFEQYPVVKGFAIHLQSVAAMEAHDGWYVGTFDSDDVQLFIDGRYTIEWITYIHECELTIEGMSGLLIAYQYFTSVLTDMFDLANQILIHLGVMMYLYGTIQ